MGDSETYGLQNSSVLRNRPDGQRIGKAADWAALNPVLAAGEVGGTSDTGVLKMGDGLTRWNSLPEGGGGTVDPVALAANAAFTATYAPLVTVRRVSTSTTAAAGEVVIVDATGGSRTVTLPAAALRSQTQVKKIDSSGNAVLIVPDAGATIDGLTSVTVPGQFDSVTCLRESATSWVRV